MGLEFPIAPDIGTCKNDASMSFLTLLAGSGLTAGWISKMAKIETKQIKKSSSKVDVTYCIRSIHPRFHGQQGFETNL